MKTFTVPVVFTLCGHITIEATDLAEAKEKCEKINSGEIEINLVDIDDTDEEVEVMTDEIQ